MYGENGHFNIQRAITLKLGKQELRLMCSAYICVKFNENMSSGFKIISGHKNCSHTKDNNSISRKTTVTVHVFCTSSHGV